MVLYNQTERDTIRRLTKPLLSNTELDELDKVLKERSCRFVSFVEDCQIYVKSRYAARQILTTYLEKKLYLKVNREKCSGVTEPWQRSYLGELVTISYSISIFFKKKSSNYLYYLLRK